MYAQPDYPAALASLQSMTSDQLKEILNRLSGNYFLNSCCNHGFSFFSDDKFEEFIKELPQMKALYNEKEMLMASNKSLAEYNMSQEPVLREAKEKLLEKYTEATRLSEEVRSLQSQLEQKSGNVRPDTLLALLEAANQVTLMINQQSSLCSILSFQEAEEESETLMDTFLQTGDTQIEQFLEEYQEKRKVAHLRRIKVDKMKELLAQKASSGNTPARHAPPPPMQYSGNALPYPSQAYNNMPLPPGYR